MHPAVEPQRLHELSIYVRRHTTAAYKPTATADSIARVLAFIGSPRLPFAQSHLLLPIVYTHLDPATIPTPTQLEALARPPNDEDRERLVGLLQRVIMALRVYVKVSEIPRGAETWLWPRVWPWFQFLDQHMEFLSAVQIFAALTNGELANASAFVATIFRIPELDSRMALGGTEGVKTILGRVLADFSDNCDLHTRRRSWLFVAQLLHLLGHCDLSNSQNMAEVVAGVGCGGYDTLAYILVSLLRRIIGDTCAGEMKTRFVIIHSIVQICERNHSGLPSEYSLAIGDLSRAFVEQDGATVLVQTLLFLSNEGASFSFCKPFFLFLLRILHNCIGTTYYDAALENGLLLAVVQLAQKGYLDTQESDLFDCARILFHHVLPQSLVYAHTVIKLSKIIAQSQSFRFAFQRSAVSPLWKAFARLPFVEVLAEMVKAERAPSLQACDNLECPRIDDRTNFRRCKSCNAVYYCSRTCQKLDWEAGHRDSCSLHAPWTLSNRIHPDLAIYDRRLIGALVHHCYEANFSSILAEQITFLAHGLSDAAGTSRDILVVPLAVVFDFTSANPSDGPKIEIVSAFDVVPAGSLFAGEWGNAVRRAQGSQGRIGLHLARVRSAERERERVFLVPLRMSVSAGTELEVALRQAVAVVQAARVR
ncbi:hypothetical protein C8F01DRAFT_445733 [Mycena amicta]|nr:hypothetical protein C8F01DRAFT_445733 [Mycena amicta]